MNMNRSNKPLLVFLSKVSVIPGNKGTIVKLT